MVINDTYLDDRDAGITYLGGGKMLLTYFCHPWQFYAERRGWIDSYANDVTRPMAEGILNGYANMPDEHNKFGSFVRLSQDYGNTWDEAIKVPVTAPHGPIKLKNGKLFFLGKEFHSGDESLEQGAIYAFESADDGKTWQYGYCIAGDTGGAIKGNKIDLFFNSRSECLQFGRKSAIVYVLD